MTVTPLMIPVVNWPAFTKEVEAVLGYSPTRGLDAAGLFDIKDPAAFVACVDLNNKPLEALRQLWNPYILEHGFLSVLLRVENHQPLEQLAFLDLSIIGKKGETESVYIISGTIAKWKQAILYSEYASLFLCHVLDAVLIALKQTGYRELFSD